MIKLKTLKYFEEDWERCLNCGCDDVHIDALKEMAIEELKFIRNDLMYRAPEQLTGFDKILIDARRYIKWKFDIKDEELE